MLQLGIGVAAWVLGISVASVADVHQATRLVLATTALAIVVCQLVFSALQLVGIDPFPLPAEIATLMGSRVHGTLNHPNNLGKTLVLLAALVLPLIDDPSRQLRKLSLLTIAGCGLGVALTQGRANIAAFIIMITIRVIVMRGVGAVQRRVGFFFLLAVTIMPFIPEISARFLEDPGGGSRDHFMELAISQFERTPWWGIGPNEYVHVIGQYDALTAGGLPVHNSYMLAVVELGLVGATLMLFPLLAAIVRSLRECGRDGYRGRAAASSVAIGVGFVAIAATGWGALSGSILPLWLFTLAFLRPMKGQKLSSISQPQTLAVGEPSRGWA
ncbi:O-antigen ligase family protein [Microbacterium horticulturae]